MSRDPLKDILSELGGVPNSYTDDADTKDIAITLELTNRFASFEGL
jgi:hypothetical protein